MVKNPPAVQEMWVQSLGWEKKMVTHSSILAWEILWTEEPGSLQSMGSKRVGHDLVTEQQFAKVKMTVLFSLSAGHSWSPTFR